MCVCARLFFARNLGRSSGSRNLVLQRFAQRSTGLASALSRQIAPVGQRIFYYCALSLSPLPSHSTQDRRNGEYSDRDVDPRLLLPRDLPRICSCVTFVLILLYTQELSPSLLMSSVLNRKSRGNMGEK